jgi:hypothetical protein
MAICLRQQSREALGQHRVFMVLLNVSATTASHGCPFFLRHLVEVDDRRR